jgi:BMFP domain-containing protein YqiC
MCASLHHGKSGAYILKVFLMRPAGAPHRQDEPMQTSNRILDDLAKVASGAASTLVGVKQEVEALVRQQVERFVAEFDLVRRDEFEAVQATAANARAEQERLEQRVADLERKLAGVPSGTDAPAAAPGGD